MFVTTCELLNKFLFKTYFQLLKQEITVISIFLFISDT